LRQDRLLRTASAGLLTACAPRAWPLITRILLLAALAIIMTPFERIVILLCILRQTDPTDPCPYLRLPESARQNNAAPRYRAGPSASMATTRKEKAKTQSGETLSGRPRNVSS